MYDIIKQQMCPNLSHDSLTVMSTLLLFFGVHFSKDFLMIIEFFSINNIEILIWNEIRVKSYKSSICTGA